MSNDKSFEVTPTLKNGKVDWEMCRVEGGQKKDCGKSNGTYPNVVLDAGKGAYNFKVSITGDQTGLGIKFANDGLAIKKGEPVGPGVQKQIGAPNGNGTKVLTFVDNNSMPNKDHPNPVVITYGLNFTDQNGNAVTAIDPDITNGGTNFIEAGGGGGHFAGSYADYLMPAFIGLVAGIILTLLVQRFMR